MTPERTSDVVDRWVRFYTRNLPTPTAQRRIDEIKSDLHDHIAHQRGLGTSDRRIALSILSRAARGLPADASWRRQAKPAKRKGMTINKDTAKQVLGVLAALILAAIGIAGIIYGEADDSPGGQLLGVLLVLGGVWLGVRVVRTLQRTK